MFRQATDTCVSRADASLGILASATLIPTAMVTVLLVQWWRGILRASVVLTYVPKSIRDGVHALQRYVGPGCEASSALSFSGSSGRPEIQRLVPLVRSSGNPTGVRCVRVAVDDNADGPLAARAFARAMDGDDEAVEELADGTLEGSWLAGWALQVATELRAATAEQRDGRPRLSAGAERRLARAVADLVQGR